MSTNIDKFEAIIESARGASEFGFGPTMTSMQRSLACRLVGALVQLEDTGFIADDDKREAAVRDLEGRVDRTAGMLSWVSSYVDPQYSTDGESTVAFMASPIREGGAMANSAAHEEALKAKSEMYGIDIEYLRQAEQTNRQRNDAGQEKTAAVLKENPQRFAKAINDAIHAPVPSDVDMNDREAGSLFAKFGEILARQATYALADFERTLMPGRKREKLADFKLLMPLAEEAEKLAHHIRQSVDNSSDRAPVETQAASAA